jgi:hypothetical protein
MLRVLAILLGLAASGTVAAWPAVSREEGDTEHAARVVDPPPEEGIVLCGLPMSRGRTAPRSSATEEPQPEAVAAAGAAVAEELVAEDCDLDFDEQPDDPIEVGPCRLVVRFVREGDEQPVQPRAELWRVGAPCNRDWTWGDQSHGHGAWRDGALVFERLPYGRYRVQTLGARRGSDDPPPFDVVDPETEVRLVVPMPPTHRVFLIAVDEHGRRIQAGRSYTGGSSRHGSEETPRWLQVRAPRDAGPEWCERMAGLGWFESSCCGGHGDGAPIEAGPQGFEISRFAEPSRCESASHRATLRDAGRCDIDVRIDADEEGAPGDRTYLGVSAPMAFLASHVSLPDGTSALEAGARVWGDCAARRVAPGDGPDVWRTLWPTMPINVRVSLAGYEHLIFETRVACSPERRYLVPKPVAPPEVRAR